MNSSNPCTQYSFLSVVSSSVSFITVLNFFKNRSFSTLGWFIPRYFILFDVMVNGIIFLISFSGSLLLVYRNAINFFILILYPTTLPNSLTRSSSFLSVSLGFSMYSIVSSLNNIRHIDQWNRRESLEINQCTYIQLISNKEHENTQWGIKVAGVGIFVLFLISESDFAFSPLSVMLAVGLPYPAFTRLRHIPSIPTLWRVCTINTC